MTKLDVFESDRGERELYFKDQPPDFPLPLPITRDGFEALLEIAASKCDIPVDDELRQLLVSVIHSIDRKTSEFKMQDVCGAFVKCYSNQISYIINAEIEAKVRAARKTASPDLTLVGEPKVPNENEAEAPH